MPRYVTPALLGVHRHACLSLYRALLGQCSRPWLSSENSNEIRKLVTSRFRDDKLLVSPGKITGSLNGGYEALDLLDSCSQGNTESVGRVDALLAQTRPVLARRDKIREAAAERESKKTPKPEYKPEPILSRPRPHVTGIRQVPRLVTARGVPFLRIKKPQPEVLSHVIKSKLDARWKLILRRDRLKLELIMAYEEDTWDRLIGQREKDNYGSTTEDALDQVENKILETDQKNLKLARDMWNVVLKERELAEKEKAEREERVSHSNGNKA